MNILVFDIGGTEIKYGIIINDKLEEKYLIATNGELGVKSVMNNLIKITNEFKQRFELDGIGISSAGIINPEEGYVMKATGNIVDYTGFRIKEYLEENLHLPVWVENDVNCFLYAEKYINQHSHNFIVLTIGTGIGGASYINGNIYRGNYFSGNEFGLTYHNNLQPWEKCASTSALIKNAKKRGINIKNGIELFNLYDNNDPLALEVVNQFYDDLAIGIVNLIYTYNPECVIIGGGISNRGEKFLNEINHAIQNRLDPFYAEQTTIQLSVLKNVSGMYGAYYHFLEREKRI